MFPISVFKDTLLLIRCYPNAVVFTGDGQDSLLLIPGEPDYSENPSMPYCVFYQGNKHLVQNEFRLYLDPRTDPIFYPDSFMNDLISCRCYHQMQLQPFS